MNPYLDNYKTALSLNEKLVAATMEYWTAWSYPAIYFAKFL